MLEHDTQTISDVKLVILKSLSDPSHYIAAGSCDFFLNSKTFS